MSQESFQTESVATEPVTGDTTTPESATDGESAEAELPKTFTQEEMNAATHKAKAIGKRQAERDAQQRAANARQVQATPPDPARFTTQESYNDAVVNHRAEQIVTQREQQKKQTETHLAYEDRVEEFRTKHPDFDTKFHNDLPVTPVMGDAILESDIGPAIAYYLGDNPDESKRISGLRPASQAREIGKIEAGLIANPTHGKKVSSAPDPIKPLGSGSSSPSYSTSDPRSIKGTSMAEWAEQRNKELAKKNR
jgi:hypothetical protein